MALNKEFTDLVKEYLADGIISAKERHVLLKKAERLGIDIDEADLYIDAQQQKVDQEYDAITTQRRGKSCPFCSGSVPLLAEKCPHCGENITPEASKEMQEILDNLEDALVAFKSGKNIVQAKALVERYARKARLYYSSNPKIIRLLDEIALEMASVENKVKKQAFMNSLVKRWKLIAGTFAVCILAVVIYVSTRPTPASDPKLCTEAVNNAISEGNVSQAEAYCAAYLAKHYQGSKDIMTALNAIADFYIASGELDKASRFCAENDLRTTAVRIAESFLQEGRLEDAANVCSINYLQETAPKVAEKFLQQGKIEDAAALCSQVRLIGDYPSPSTAKPIAFEIQDAYIALGKYDEAEKCLSYHGSTDEYYDFLCKCISHMLKTGKSSRVKSYIDRKIGHYDSSLTHEAEWQQAAVKKRLYRYAGI
jgi:tetratricopeptide (TPR) repeat protein